jgi:peptidoglycan/LPS O-acetylase OafA/YrhL
MLLFLGMGYVLSCFLPPYRTLAPRLLSLPGYSVELESMRGILALSVVIHHAVVWYFLLYRNTSNISGSNSNFYSQLGTAPVTFFFFITSFLFWTKLIVTPKQPFWTFMYARLRRLGPAYLGGAIFMLGLVALFTHFKLHTTTGNLARQVFHVLMADNPELNGLTEAPWLWGVTWTLRLEFLFYLLIPFLGWFAQTIWKSVLFVGGCNVLYSATLVILGRHWHFPGFFLIQSVVRSLSFTFCVGILAAHIVRLPRVKKAARSVWAAPLALLLIAITLFFLPAMQGGLESLFLAIPFIAAACGCNFWGALRTRALLFLGQISYSVYLIHCLIYGAILLPLAGILGPGMRDPSRYWVIVVMTGPAIILVATLWHRTLEYPFLSRKARAIPPQTLPLNVSESRLSPAFKEHASK